MRFCNLKGKKKPIVSLFPPPNPTELPLLCGCCNDRHESEKERREKIAPISTLFLYFAIAGFRFLFGFFSFFHSFVIVPGMQT